MSSWRCFVPITLTSSPPSAHTYARVYTSFREIKFPLAPHHLAPAILFPRSSSQAKLLQNPISVICPCQAHEWPRWRIWHPLVCPHFPWFPSSTQHGWTSFFLRKDFPPWLLRSHPLRVFVSSSPSLPPLQGQVPQSSALLSSCPPQGLKSLNSSLVGWWCSPTRPLLWALGSHIQLPTWYLQRPG